jgi:hypothetical protein
MAMAIELSELIYIISIKSSKLVRVRVVVFYASWVAAVQQCRYCMLGAPEAQNLLPTTRENSQHCMRTNRRFQN